MQTDTDIDMDVGIALGWTLDPKKRIWYGPDGHSVTLTFGQMFMAFPPAAAYAGCYNRYWQPTRDANQAINALSTLPKGTQWRVSCKTNEALGQKMCAGFTFSSMGFVIEDTELARCLSRGFLEIKRQLTLLAIGDDDLAEK